MPSTAEAVRCCRDEAASAAHAVQDWSSAVQTRTKTEGATGLFTVTAARLPELIDEIGIGKFQIIQFLPVLFVPLCEGANVLVPREALEQKPQSLPKPQSLSFS